MGVSSSASSRRFVVLRGGSVYDGLVGRLLAFLATVFALSMGVGCQQDRATAAAKPEPAAATATATASTRPAPSNTAPESERCAPCAAARSANVTFAFEGEFLDANCTQPVAHADVPACVAVSTTGASHVSLAELAPPRKGDKSPRITTIVRQLRADEPAKLFAKRDGKCVPHAPLGWKFTPEGCDRSKVCRREGGELGCSGCRLLDTGCPDYVASRIFVLLALGDGK